jgi:hypothetical protein
VHGRVAIVGYAGGEVKVLEGLTAFKSTLALNGSCGMDLSRVVRRGFFLPLFDAKESKPQ